MDRLLGRNLRDLITLLDELRTQGIHFQSLTEHIDTETAAGRAMWQMIGVLAELERSLITERTRAGVQAAQQRGVKFGPKPKLSPQQMTHARHLRAQVEPVRVIAALLKVHRATLYRVLAD
jgi:DNA invertase Pin-like site-specific DNA recombinase